MSRRTKIVRPEVFRQSLLSGFVTCPRRTRFALHAGDDVTTGWMEDRAALGSAFHEVAAETLRTLKRQNEERISHQEAIEILYEVMRGSEVVLGIAALDELRWLVLQFSKTRWSDPATTILAVEETLTLDVECEDGEVRTLKGQPDVVKLHADGIMVVDFKTGMGKPKQPRGPEPAEGEVVEGAQYLSDRGHFQGDTYGLLALSRYLPAKSYTFREFHVRSGQIRQVTLTREDMEHVQRRVALIMEQLDRGISEGPKSGRWRPRAGSHCTRQCPVARSCPIPPEQRGDGVIDSQAKADRAAAAFAVLSAQREGLRSQLKAAHEEGGWTGRANEGEEVRYEPEFGPGRKFGVWPLREPVVVEDVPDAVADMFRRAT